MPCHSFHGKRRTYKVLCVVSPPPSIEVTGSSGTAANTTQRTRWTKPRAIIWVLNRVYNPAGSDREPVNEPLKRGSSGKSHPNGGLEFLKARCERGFEWLCAPDLRLEGTPLFSRHTPKTKRRHPESPIPSDPLSESHDVSYPVTPFVCTEVRGSKACFGISRPRLQAGQSLGSSPVNWR